MKAKEEIKPRHQDYNCLIYYSDEDKSWIAHSLTTDQIGYGDCVVDSLKDLMNAVNQVFELARQQSDVQVFNPAPPEIQKRVKSAKVLPKELYEIAFRKVNGDWPDYLKLHADLSHKQDLKVGIPVFV